MKSKIDYELIRDRGIYLSGIIIIVILLIVFVYPYVHNLVVEGFTKIPK